MGSKQDERPGSTTEEDKSNDKSDFFGEKTTVNLTLQRNAPPPDPSEQATRSFSPDLPTASHHLPTLDLALPGVPQGDAPRGEQPAHLALPSFPEVAMPGADLSGAAPTTEAHARPEGAPPPRRPSVKPPAPPPRTRRPRLPEVDLSLPELMTAKVKRNLTLIGIQLPEDKALGWHLIVPIVGLLAIVGAALSAWIFRDKLFSFGPPAPAVPVAAPTLSPHDQASIEFVAGATAYNGKDFHGAIGRFEKALSLDPNMADAHRSLGIVYASTHEQAKAVDEYRLYLHLMPKATDANDVQKIVDDYAMAQAKAAAAAAAAAAPASDAQEAAKADKSDKPDNAASHALKATKGKKTKAKKHTRR